MQEAWLVDDVSIPWATHGGSFSLPLSSGAAPVDSFLSGLPSASSSAAAAGFLFQQEVIIVVVGVVRTKCRMGVTGKMECSSKVLIIRVRDVNMHSVDAITVGCEMV